MSSYAYIGYDSGGGVHRGRVEASSPKHARMMLLSQGIVTEFVRSAGDAPGGRRMGPEQRERVYREVGVLLQSGLPLERALTVMMEGAEPRLALSTAALREAIRDGSDMATACATVCGGIPSDESAALMAAERSGTLAGMCVSLSDSLETAARLRARVRAMLLYPAFVMVLGLAVAFLIGGVLAPQAAQMLTALRGEAPVRALLMLRLARWAAWVLLLFPLVGLAGYFRLRSLAGKSEGFAIRMERHGLQIPVFRKLLVPLWSARFARVLAVLNQAGVPLVECMELAGKATGCRLIAGQAAEQAAALRHGASLSGAIASIPALNRVLVEWVHIGETSGSLASMMLQAAGRLDSDFERRLTRLLAWVEPVLILLIGLFVMLVALTVLLPVLTVAREVVA